MNFSEVVQEVVNITKRPDKLAEIRTQVNAAINFCCIEIEFGRDLEEVLYPLSDPSAYIHSIPLTEFIRWRKFCYIKAPSSKHCLQQRDPDKIFEAGKEARDVFYIAGNEVKISLCATSPSLIIGYFRYPPVLTDSSPDFWLLEVSPYMIIDKACASIFLGVGNNTEASSHLVSFNNAFTSARRDYKYGASYG